MDHQALIKVMANVLAEMQEGDDREDVNLFFNNVRRQLENERAYTGEEFILERTMGNSLEESNG